MDAYELSLIDDADDRAAYHRIRRLVLFEARGRFDYSADGPDEMKPENLPLLLKFHGRNVGTVRLDTKPDGRAIVRLVAFTSPLQRRGHGRVLMERLEDLAKRLKIRELFVHAAPDAAAFYQKIGYSPFEFETGASQSIQLHKLI